MSTEGTIDYNSLSWVKKQLDSILSEAQSALSDYIESPDDSAALQKCIDSLKLVYGTLQMVEVYGAAMLAEEMLETANAQLAGEIDKPEDAFDVLMRAMLQLPDYLEGVQSGNKDAPIALLPLMNDLRTARGEKLLSESVLFLPDMEQADAGLEQEMRGGTPGQLQAQAKRLRTHYQIGLLDYLKDNKTAAALQRMAAVLNKLEQVTVQPATGKLWKAVAALIEALRDEGLDANISVKMLLGQVDRQMKQLLDEGEEKFARNCSQELLKNLLYYVGRSSSAGDKVSSLKQAYSLDDLLPTEADLSAAGSGMAGLNAELFDTVSQGIRDDLDSVKDALEIYVHSEDRNPAQLAPVSEQLQRIGDTYGMLGLGIAREKILQQKQSIDSIVASGTPADESTVMEIAANLLQAESELDNFVAERAGLSDSGRLLADSSIPASEYRQVLDTVIQQALNNFSNAREAILAFIAGIGGREQLEVFLQKLEEVRGAAMMLPMQSIESQIQRLLDYVRIALRDNGHVPDAEEQDVVADVVTSIEYYLEALIEGRPGVEQGLRTGDAAAEKLERIVQQYPQGGDSTQQQAAADEPEAPTAVALDEKPLADEDEAHSDSTQAQVIPIAEPPQDNAPPKVGTTLPGAEDYEQYIILGDDADEEILEIFIEEAVEVLAEMHAHLPRWIANRDDEEALTTIRRSFHTLKGSGRLVGAQLIGEFSWKFENMLNRVIDKRIEPNDTLCAKVEEALAVLPQLIEQLKGNREPVENVYELMAAADALSEGQELPVAASTLPEASTADEAVVEDAAAEEIDAGDDDDDNADAPDESVADESPAQETVIRHDDASPAATEENASEADTLADESAEISIDQLMEDASEDSIQIDDFALPEMDASTENAEPDETDVANAAEEDAEIELQELTFSVDDIASEAVDDGQTITLQASDSGPDSTDAAPEIVSLDIGDTAQEETPHDEMIDALSDEIGMDPVLLKIYLEESQAHLQQVNTMLAEHRSGERLMLADKNLIRAFHTLYGSARTAEIESIAKLSGVTEKYIKARNEAEDNTLPEHAVVLIADVVERVSEMLELVKQGSLPQPDRELHEKINRLLQEELQQQLQTVSVRSDDALAGDATAADSTDADLAGADADDVVSVDADVPAVETDKESEGQGVANINYGDIDEDLIDIFIEEAEELLESCESSLLKLREDSDSKEDINQLQRDMHTLKGGARMAELTPVGNLTHALESLVVKWSEGKVKADQVLFDHLNDSLDALNSMLESVKARKPMQDSSLLVSRLEVLTRGEVPEQRAVERFDIELDELKAVEEPDEEEAAAETEAESVPVIRGRRASDVPEEVALAQETPHWGERATDSGRDIQEQVRVRADLLNDLVNYAGEVNIYHARMGKQVADYSFNISELESTVIRLKEQLRKLEIETEIQIRSSYEKEREDDNYDADFDPLEMDRYSTIQQLSRSLAETASDVESIKDILQDITRDSETLLLQESRVSTELQEGLMRTRMVRFGGLGTRLRRITRQTARELNKEVELEIIGDSNEVDRTVLDRIIAPLEHMLRNAVAHGIEPPEQRRARGKPETGKIVIKVDRQGADVVIRVSDDGAGIDVEAIRAKAIRQGLIEADSKLSDHDVLQLILKSGFSTAETVSQIAGRGVGMDVVDSEIKQLGGLLEIDTRKGRGTEFTVRLPLTLAINQALLVNAGDDVYAIPLASIEGVVRITGVELQRFYDSGQTKYEFNGVEFELKHLGHLLTGHQADYSKQLRLYPVLLAKVGDQHFALHVDDLVGRREIVVKPVGLQIGTVRGIAGATILADGRVVLILEMSALVVGEALFKHVEEEETTPQQAAEQKKVTTVMVVDDSITIRKVTARMLERRGIHVVTAKDGVDATNQLQEMVPDLMLLDIEMPRMDGFELATYIRNDEKLKDLPIIMITSRTGSKHKEKALEIGVNQYLGKPYQEEELMKNIQQLISVA